MLSPLGMQRNDISSANGSCKQVTQGKGENMQNEILATVQNIKVFEIILVWLYKPWKLVRWDQKMPVLFESKEEIPGNRQSFS